MPAPKRGGEVPVGFKLMKEALDAPDAVLAAPEYLHYKATQEARGGSVLCPLRWCLYKVLGPLDEDSAGQPPQRQCTASGASGDRLAEDIP